MRGFDPMTSFGPDVASRYDDELRGDEADTVACAELDVTMGDMAGVLVDGSYGLVYLVYNTLFNLLTQDDQVRCFVNVARHLADDGVFLVEAFTPNAINGLDQGQYVDAEHVGVDGVTLDVGRYDPATQLLDESHVTIGAEGIRVSPIVCRLAWPSEIDLMARLAGLRLQQRWSGWNGEAFVAGSRRHVSVYGR